MANSYDPRPLNEAVKAMAGENGELFDVELLYKTGELAQWIYRLERLIIQLSSTEEPSDEQLNEAEANLSEALEISRTSKAIIEEYMTGAEISAYCYILNHKAKLLMTAERICVTEGDNKTISF